MNHRIKLVLHNRDIRLIRRYTTLSAFATFAVINLSHKKGVSSAIYNDYVIMAVSTEKRAEPVISISESAIDMLPKYVEVRKQGGNYPISRVSMGIAQKVNLAIYDALRNGMVIDLEGTYMGNDD